MKKIIFLNLFLALSIASFGQPNNKKVKLMRRKTQKRYFTIKKTRKKRKNHKKFI